MSVTTVANAIQDAIGASSLILSAPHMDAWPGSINTADLPLVLTRPGAATWPHDCLDDVRCHRTYVTDIYVKPNSQGLFHEGITETLAIIQAVGVLLTGSSSGWSLGSAVFDSEPRDKGLLILSYGETLYRGTSFEIDVIEDV